MPNASRLHNKHENTACWCMICYRRLKIKGWLNFLMIGESFITKAREISFKQTFNWLFRNKTFSRVILAGKQHTTHYRALGLTLQRLYCFSLSSSQRSSNVSSCSLMSLYLAAFSATSTMVSPLAKSTSSDSFSFVRSFICVFSFSSSCFSL